MIYCVSDIHGELDKFERLLTLIQFSENDHLYVIGDAIDRCAWVWTSCGWSWIRPT